MAQQTQHLHDEPDIGSGEKSPGQQDTEKMIEQVGNSDGQKRSSSNSQQSGSEQRNPAPGKNG